MVRVVAEGSLAYSMHSVALQIRIPSRGGTCGVHFSRLSISCAIVAGTQRSTENSFALGSTVDVATRHPPYNSMRRRRSKLLILLSATPSRTWTHVGTHARHKVAADGTRNVSRPVPEPLLLPTCTYCLCRHSSQHKGITKCLEGKAHRQLW